MSGMDGAHGYWRRANDTFVAPDSYYAAVGAALRADVLPRLAPGAETLDIGCGDGTFTEVLASRSAHVDAVDVSPDLIAQARRRRIANASFELGDALTLPERRYDLVASMGVLVCIADDTSFESALLAAANAVRPQGYLLLRETVSGWGRRETDSGGYLACYRTRSAYFDLLGGFEIVVDRQLARWSRTKRRTNHLWLLRKSATSE